MSQPDDRDASYVWDMLAFARELQQIVAGVDEQAYLSSLVLRRSVERCLELIGEAARRISPDFRSTHPEIPWTSIVGQRNVLAHEYGRVSDRLVWRVAHDETAGRSQRSRRCWATSRRSEAPRTRSDVSPLRRERAARTGA